MRAYDATTKTGRYANAKEKKSASRLRSCFPNSSLALQLIPTVKQEQINQALAELSRAEGKLNGKAADFSSLEKIHQEELKFQEKNAKFIYAGNEEKKHLAAFRMHKLSFKSRSKPTRCERCFDSLEECQEKTSW